MAPPLSSSYPTKSTMYSLPEDFNRQEAECWRAEPSCREEAQQSLSHSSFEEYENFEEHLDKILLEQVPFDTMPEGQVCSGAQSGRSADTRKLSEAVESAHDEGCVWYCLAVLDEETGSPLRPATDEETEVLAQFLCPSSADECSSISTCPPFHVSSEEEEGPSTSTTDGSVSCSPRSDVSASGAVSALALTKAIRSAMPPHKSGGPCDHCHATESPQWRRGPPSKPTLCNACGTRYRRTQQLGTVVPGQRSTKGGSLPGRKRKSATRDFALRQRAAKLYRGSPVEA